MLALKQVVAPVEVAVVQVAQVVAEPVASVAVA